MKAIAKNSVLTWVALVISGLMLGAFKGDKDPMHKRIFDVKVTEYRDGKPKNKSEDDEMEFKDGKFFSNLAFDKMEFKWMKYEIKLDTVLMETDSINPDDKAEVKYYEILITSTNEKDELLTMNFKVSNWEIEGTMKLTKKDKLKKHFEFIGKERIKMKKEKKKDEKKEEK